LTTLTSIQSGRDFVRSEVLIVVTIKITVLWDVTLCSMINVTNVLEEPAVCLARFQDSDSNSDCTAMNICKFKVLSQHFHGGEGGLTEARKSLRILNNPVKI
jgi:hypothetical protein